MGHLGYSKTLTVEIKRSKHKVGFRVGTSVDDLIELLKKVPTGSKVDEVVDSQEDDQDVATIEFYEESRIGKP